MAGQLIMCIPKMLPQELLASAAERAVEINPLNHPALHRLAGAMKDFSATKEYIAVVTNKYWHTNGVRLTVGFLETTPGDLQARILSHMNAWGARCNVLFTLSRVEPQIRITREGDGYWSYVGTDVLSIEHDQPTMSLQGFTMNTPESEYHRVVRHETGHTLGCPHEHMRAELVARIDPAKAIEYFKKSCSWNADMVRQQVLTSIEESSLLGTPHPDPNSIMCYQIPGCITRDEKPIPGGLDIDEQDYQFMAGIYPGVPQADGHVAHAGAQSPDTELARLRADNAVLRNALAIYARTASA